MGLKCFGAFVLPPEMMSGPSGIGISLAVCPSLHLFYLFDLKFVQNYQLGWHLLKQQFLHVDPTECFSTGATIGEVRGVRSGWGQKGGMSSGVLSKELLKCQLRVTAAVWTRGCPCWCNVVALGALRVSEPFHMLRLCKRLFRREKHQNGSPGGITSKLISAVLELFLMWGVSLNHLLNFFLQK